MQPFWASASGERIAELALADRVSPCPIFQAETNQHESDIGLCATIQSAAADRLSTVTVGGGANRSSSPGRYLPVETSTALPSPARKAPATSASASSPTITACFGAQSMLVSAASKNSGAGLPKTSALCWLANSSAATNAPASKLSRPSASLKERFFASAINWAPSISSRNARLRLAYQKASPASPTTTAR